MDISPVTHVLFDMDGLILNTEDLYTIAFQNLLTPYGKTYTFELKVKLMGLQSLETASRVIDELQLPMTVDEFVQKSAKEFETLFPEAQLMPGAKKVIEHLHRHKIPMGLATSSSESSYLLKAARHSEIFSLFDHKTFGSSEPEVRRGKPHPDIFLVAASKFPDKPKPEKCLVFEDAVNGVAAARSAGMQVVMVPDPRLDESYTRDATIVLKTLEYFKPELFGLPPY